MAQPTSHTLENSQIGNSSLDNMQLVTFSLPTIHHEPPPVPNVSAMGIVAPSLPLVDSPTSTAPSQVRPYSPLAFDPPANCSQNMNVSHASEVSTNTEPRTHHIVTRFMNNIYKPKNLFIVTKHPIPPSLEPTYVAQALTEP